MWVWALFFPPCDYHSLAGHADMWPSLIILYNIYNVFNIYNILFTGWPDMWTCGPVFQSRGFIAPCKKDKETEFVKFRARVRCREPFFHYLGSSCSPREQSAMVNLFTGMIPTQGTTDGHQTLLPLSPEFPLTPAEVWKKSLISSAFI